MELEKEHLQAQLKNSHEQGGGDDDDDEGGNFPGRKIKRRARLSMAVKSSMSAIAMMRKLAGGSDGADDETNTREGGDAEEQKEGDATGGLKAALLPFALKLNLPATSAPEPGSNTNNGTLHDWYTVT